jgi:uncharacterized lipoprotein YmbA
MRTTMATLPCALALALASACGTSPPTTYHVLSSPAGTRDTGELGPGVLVVAVAGFPEYLDRRELALLVSHTLELDEQHFWAEPLEVGFARVLAESLDALGHPAIPFGPLSQALPGTRTILVDVTRFEVIIGREGIVAATWVIQDENGELSAPARRAHLQAGPKGKATTDAIPEVLSLAVEALAREIAATLPDGAPRPGS